MTNKELTDEVMQEVEGTEDWTDDDGEVRELTAVDFKRMKPFTSLPLDMQEMLLAINHGPVTFRAVPDAEEVTLKLSRPVLERFRASGVGWEGRVDEALRQWMEEHQAS